MEHSCLKDLFAIALVGLLGKVRCQHSEILEAREIRHPSGDQSGKNDQEIAPPSHNERGLRARQIDHGQQTTVHALQKSRHQHHHGTQVPCPCVGVAEGRGNGVQNGNQDVGNIGKQSDEET